MDRSRMIVAVLGALAALAAPGAGQQWATPPPESVVRMPSPVKLGRQDGYAAAIGLLRTTDPRFHSWVLEVEVTAERGLKLERLRLATDRGSFEVELRPGARFPSDGPRPSLDVPPEAAGFFLRVETRPFNLSEAQVARLAGAERLDVTLVGERLEVSYGVRPKRLRRLQEWIAAQGVSPP